MPTDAIRVPIQLGQFGLNGSRNQARIPLGGLIDASNLTFEGDVISREGGAAKYNAVALGGGSDVIGGWSFHPTQTARSDVVLLSNGDYLLDNDEDADYADGTATGKLATGLTTTNVGAFFVEGGKEAAANNRKLFMFTGKNPVQVVSGAGTVSAALTTPPVDWTGANQPVAGFIHNNRLWGFGNANQPHIVYYSQNTNHENFTGAGAGTISVYVGQGEKLVAGAVFKGFPFLFKYPRGIYYIDARDPDIANWVVNEFNPRIGSVSACAVQQIEDDVVFMDATGQFHLLSQVGTENFGARNLSSPQGMDEYVRDNIELSKLDKVCMTYYAAKQELIVGLVGRSGVENDRRIVIDFAGDLPRFRTSARDTPISIWQARDATNVDRPVIGDSSGFVWTLDEIDINVDGNAYTSRFQTAYSDFAELDQTFRNRRKNLKFIEIESSPQNIVNYSVSLFADDRFIQTLSLSTVTSGFRLGVSKLGIDRFQSQVINIVRNRASGSGKKISVVVSASNADENFGISNIVLGVTLGN